MSENRKDFYKQSAFGCGLLVAAGGLVLLAMGVVFSIPPGHVGVVKAFGDVSETVLPAGGPYLIRPWASVARMSVQTEKNEELATVPTKGGLSVSIKAVLLYRLEGGKAPMVLKTVGVNYEEKIIDPYFRNAVRDVCADYTPESLYTNERQAVENSVLSKISKELIDRGFVCEAVMLQDPVLPAVVTERVQAKVAAEQDAIRMESVFKQREKEAMANKRQKELEAEAKVIEAEGISKAQLIIKKDLDDNYLRYLWIEALKESAKHNNATIYIPTGSDGMPFFKTVEPKK